MPSGAEYEADTGMDYGLADKLEAKGVDADAATYLGSSYSKTKGFLQVSGNVYTTASAAQGKKAFAVITKDRALFWKTNGEGTVKLTTPSYGDQQTGRHDPAGNEGIGIMELIVRRNAVVWMLYVRREHRPTLPEATLLTELKKYALKQKRRVGGG